MDIVQKQLKKCNRFICLHTCDGKLAIIDPDYIEGVEPVGCGRKKGSYIYTNHHNYMVDETVEEIANSIDAFYLQFDEEDK